MGFYWSWKKLPELHGHSRAEYRQAIWQVGLKPLRHWQVWCALIIVSTLMLLWLETLLGLEIHDNLKMAGSLLVAGLYLPFRHVYLSTLRPYVSLVSFLPTESWWKDLAKRALVNLALVSLLFLSMFGINWIVNCYDEDIDPHFAVIKDWPAPVPESDNGAIALLGLMAPAESSMIKAGQAYKENVNQAIKNHTDIPYQEEHLKYSNFSAFMRRDETTSSMKPQKGNAHPSKRNQKELFCSAGKESCWKIIRNENQAVTGWLKANTILLTRYRSLKKFPQWQHTITSNSKAPFPHFGKLQAGQALLHATALQLIQQGQVQQGLDLIGEDVSFVKQMLSGKDSLIGKMIATSMLMKDLAILSDTLIEQREKVGGYSAQIEKMLEPLTPQQMSVVAAFRFEYKSALSTIFDSGILDDYQSFVKSQQDDGTQSPDYMLYLAFHYFKKNATANMWIRTAKRSEHFFETRGVNATRPITANEFTEANLEKPTWYFNQTGKIIYLASLPAYQDYPNRLLDLNALNSLVRLQLKLIRNDVATSEVSKFVAASEQSLLNPETGKPFEWDHKLKQVYFIPSNAQLKDQYLIGGIKSRFGFSVH